jgi:hypothetical protein
MQRTDMVPAALSGTQQLKSSDEQVCETTRDPRPMGILRQPSVANLGEAKHPPDHPYALLYLGTYPGLPAVFAALHEIRASGKRPNASSPAPCPQ